MLSFYFHPSYSGSAVQALNLAKHLLSHGVLAEIVSANLMGSPAEELFHGVRVRRLPLLKRKNWQVPSFGLSLAWHLLRHRRSCDIIHAHGAKPHAVAGVLAKALGKKSLLKITMGRSDLAFQRQGRIWGTVNRFLVSRFDRYVAISEEIRRECLAGKLDPARVVVIPNGVDTCAFSPPASAEDRRMARLAIGLPDKPIVCFVGIIDARKNIDAILRIWRRALQRGGDGYLLLIGPEPLSDDGATSEYCRRLHKYVQDEGMSDSVCFMGKQTEIAAYLRSSDVFLFPSRREGMPNAVLEAMASGVACVASSIGGSVDLIEHGADGFLFDVDDELAMAATLERLLKEPETAWAVGQAARRKVVDQFSLEATAERYAGLYLELIGSMRRSSQLAAE